ncbi:hypothetical protein Droror1_Dr00013251 [Drosera rotundifolia]
MAATPDDSAKLSSIAGTVPLNLVSPCKRRRRPHRRVSQRLTVLRELLSSPAHDASAMERKDLKWDKSPLTFQYKDTGESCVAVENSPRLKVFEIDFGFWEVKEHQPRSEL